MAETILEVKDFGIEFHDHDRPERVVEHVNFILQKGEILGIVGESGSGKSMSALAIAGLLPRKKLKKEGQILFLGEDLMTMERKKLRGHLFLGEDLMTMERKKLRGLQGDEISMIFQEPMTALNPTMKIGKQVEEALRIHHPEVTAEERKKRAITWLKNVEMDDPERVYEAYPHELSGGMRQRVMIAAAMVGNPQLLIADECTTALDVTVQAQIIRLLLEINKKEQVSVLFISHDLSLIRQISNRVIVMQLGHIVEQGDVEQIFNHPQEEYTKKLIAAIPQVEL